MTDEPQRHRIELACPECGHRQQEPVIVVSSQCRACQMHFQVINGKAVAKERSVKPFTKVRREATQESAPEEPRITPFTRIRREDADGESATENPEEPRITPFTRIRREGADGEIATENPAEPRIEPFSPQRRSAAAADVPKRSLWMRLIDPVKPPRDASCFDCGHPFQALGEAQSSQCPKCGSYVSLLDYEINEHWNRNIKTRGNVKILKGGTISGSTVRCHHLTVLGELAGSVDCSGDLIIRSHGKIIGTVKCRNLRIQKGARVEFLNPVTADTAHIDGQVRGQISCTGSVTLEKRAQLHGLVRTTSLIVKPGAKHSGMIEMVTASKD